MPDCVPEGEAMSENSVYGCVFCITGKEALVAEQIEAACPGVCALTARWEKHKSVNGKKSKVQAILLPSYVFFRAPRGFVPYPEFPQENVIRILQTDRHVWQLTGADEQFARWLFSYDGLLSFSKAYREGERIRIVSGPLKDMEGSITKIDRRGRSGQVVLSFNGKPVSVWLGFDLLETLSPNSPALETERSDGVSSSNISEKAVPR